MPLHDAVWINCKKGATTEYQGAHIPSIWAKGCMLMIMCMLSVSTCLPLLGGGGKSWYIIIILYCIYITDSIPISIASRHAFLAIFYG